MKPILLFTSLLIVFSISLSEAKRKQNVEGVLRQFPFVHPIEAQSLDSIIAAKKSKLFYVIIFTNYCSGTKYALQEAAALRQQYNDEQLTILLCSSAPVSEIVDLVTVTKRLRETVPDIFWIDSRIYKDKADDRKKGLSFRDAICKPCQSDIIGVPYKILFDQNKTILEKGYESRGADFKAAFKRAIE